MNINTDKLKYFLFLPLTKQKVLNILPQNITFFSPSANSHVIVLKSVKLMEESFDNDVPLCLTMNLHSRKVVKCKHKVWGLLKDQFSIVWASEEMYFVETESKSECWTNRIVMGSSIFSQHNQRIMQFWFMKKASSKLVYFLHKVYNFLRLAIALKFSNKFELNLI